MQRPKKVCLDLATLLFLGLGMGCTPLEKVQNRLDHLSFAWSGGTLFTEPFHVTTKQLHLDTGSLFGQDVILEGQVKAMGEEHTHLVLIDGEGRMLVVLTELEDAYQTLDAENNQRVRVLGRLERGKKGLPYIRALAIRSLPSEGPENEQSSEQARGTVPSKRPL